MASRRLKEKYRGYDIYSFGKDLLIYHEKNFVDRVVGCLDIFVAKERVNRIVENSRALSSEKRLGAENSRENGRSKR